MDTILSFNASTDSVPSKVEKNGNVATLSYKHGAKLELTATEDYLAYRIQGRRGRLPYGQCGSTQSATLILRNLMYTLALDLVK